jgi:hypothetical protein
MIGIRAMSLLGGTEHEINHRSLGKKENGEGKVEVEKYKCIRVNADHET